MSQPISSLEVQQHEEAKQSARVVLLRLLPTGLLSLKLACGHETSLFPPDDLDGVHGLREAYLKARVVFRGKLLVYIRSLGFPSKEFWNDSDARLAVRMSNVSKSDEADILDGFQLEIFNQIGKAVGIFSRNQQSYLLERRKAGRRSA